MRIGLVCPYDVSKPGGVQQVVFELGTQLQDRGEEVVVVGPGTPATDAGIPFRSIGSSLTISANQSNAPVALMPSAWSRTQQAIGEVEVIHIHEPFIPLVGWAALSLRSRPLVATFHADPSSWARSLYTVMGRVGEFGLGRAVTTATSPVAASAVPEGWDSPRIVPNAIDVASYRVEIERNPHRIAFLGRDDPRKGLSVLLEAWPLIARAHPEAVLEVMGAQRPETIPGVRFRGPADENTKREVLASSQVLAAPNLGGESFGVVVAEGMAAGCAVVASDIDAFRHVLADDGILFPTGDVVALAEAIADLLEDPEKARRLGRDAQDAVKRFDWSVVVDGYVDSYREAVDRRGGTLGEK